MITCGVFFHLSQNLKDVLSDLVPKEQARIKSFKQQFGKNNIGQITVDMVSEALTPLSLSLTRGLSSNLLSIHFG